MSKAAMIDKLKIQVAAKRVFNKTFLRSLDRRLEQSRQNSRMMIYADSCEPKTII